MIVRRGGLANDAVSAIPMRLVRHYRAILSTNASARPAGAWAPGVLDRTWLGIPGQRRIEALDRVRAIGQRSRRRAGARG